MSKNGESVRVTVRCRPLSSAETQTGKQNIVQISSARGEILITKPGSDEQPKAFTFDNVYDWNSSQETIYKESAFPIVDSALQGYNGTIFAYGQTGTGKTHTMEGSSVPEEQRGIIPRAFEQVFHQIQGTPDKQFLVRVSFLEIYNEEIRDLLASNPKNKLELREKPDVGVYAQDLISLPVQSVEEMHQKLKLGRKSRVVAATEMNPGSSRSHSVFTITIEASEIGPDGKSHIRMGKLNLVDLAGSERHDKTGATGDRFVEAVNINKSLLTLGLVISALTDPKGPHIPFRHSKLTRLLQDSLGGNTKTVMIANIGPADWNFEETLNTLRYASQAKKIKNKPKINEDPKDAMLREFQEEINSLKAKIQEFQNSGQVGIQSEKIVKVEDEKRIKEMEEKLAKEKEEIQSAAEEERQRILKQKNLADEERKKLLEELKKQEEAQKEAKEGQSELLKKLKKMEEKVLIGSKAMEQALKQEKEHQKIREELEENRINKQRLAEQLAKKEEENLMREKEYKNQKEEVEDKTKKLKRLYQKFQAAQAEIRDLQDDLFREREFYQDELREMDRQFKLRNLIISHFVPNDVEIMIRSRAVWSEEIDDWILPSLHLSGNAVTAAKRSKPGSAHGFVKPIAEQAQMRRSFGDTNTRFRGDNVIDIPIEMPENTLEEFRKTVSKTVKNTVYNTLNMEHEDITLMGMEDKPNVYYMYVDDGIEKEEAMSGKEGTKKRIQSAARVGSAGKKKPEQAARPESRGGRGDRGDEKGVVYPKAKGLVGKNTV